MQTTTMALCKPSSDELDLSLQCVALWSTMFPAIPLLVLLLISIPKPSSLRSLTTPLLLRDEAEALDATATPAGFAKPHPPQRRMLLLSAISLAQSLSWFFVGSLYLLFYPAIYTTRAYVTALAWLYVVVRLILHPPVTAPLDAFALVLSHFAGASLQLGIIAYDSYLGVVELSAWAVVVNTLNLAAVLLALLLLLSMPTVMSTERIGKTQTVS